MMQWMQRLAGVALGLACAGVAGAATLTEGSIGDFSGDFRAPTVIAAGADRVEGIWAGGSDHDLLAFTGLRPGAQTVTLRFAPLTPIGPTDWSFAAGGDIYWKTAPFPYSAWEGTLLGTVGIMHWNRDRTFEYSLTLDDGFAGDLWLGLFNTYGTLAYAISAPGNAALAPVVPPVTAPAPVPLPGAAPLLVLGLGALGAAAGLRRRRAAIA